MAFDEAIKASSSLFTPPAELAGKFQYGTAGFRMNAKDLDAVVFRVGLLASLRSRYKSSRTIGVMITASHNPPVDNGIKLVDPYGDMLESSWEQYATRLANASSDDELVREYNKIAAEKDINLDAAAKVIYARDTRASGSRLVKALVAALEATKVHVTDFKLATTPQLHYYTRCINTKGTHDAYGEATEQGYYEKYSTAFKQINEDIKFDGGVVVDCANGVGGPKLRELQKHIPSELLKITVINDDVHKPDTLNHKCGADYVKTTQSAPPSSNALPGTRCCSLDGDADRIVYYFVDKTNTFRLLDGDRIATLAASFIADLARKAGLSEKLKIGVVQTAYANGAATTYVEKYLNLPVICTPTGVKHLHHAALRFDVGVYFEANGHGTVLFSESAMKTIHTTQPESPAENDALTTLIHLTDLINQAVGDALSDMLLVETVLAHKRWTCQEWFYTYQDLPNRLARVEVQDRGAFKTVPGSAERKLSSPQGLQEQIDTLVSKYNDARAFVRASGTEDAVRVYAEARSKAEAEDLVRQVSEMVRRSEAVARSTA